jgi:hypothetical protein
VSAHDWRALIQYLLTEEEARQMVEGYGHPEVDDAPIQMLAEGQGPSAGDPRVFLGTHNMLRGESYVGCFTCEQVWSPEAVAAGCPGEPTGRLTYVDPAGRAIPETMTPAPGGNVSGTMTAVRRNDLCPCGSGRKFKRCHGA